MTSNSRLDKIEERLEVLEKGFQEDKTQRALISQQVGFVALRFDKIDKELKEIKDATWKVVYAVLASFGAGIAAWIINGGLSNGGIS